MGRVETVVVALGHRPVHMKSFMAQVIRAVGDSSGHLWRCGEVFRTQGLICGGRRIFKSGRERDVGKKQSGSENIDLTLEFISLGH